jgi:hypothetical protein
LKLLCDGKVSWAPVNAIDLQRGSVKVKGPYVIATDCALAQEILQGLNFGPALLRAFANRRGRIRVSFSCICPGLHYQSEEEFLPRIPQSLVAVYGIRHSDT